MIWVESYQHFTGKCKFQHKTQIFILLLLLQLVSIHHSKLYFNMHMEHSAVASGRKENGETSYSLGKLIFFSHGALLWPRKKLCCC